MRILQLVKDYLPIIATAATLVLWVDTRYMHKSISDIRYIDLQIAFYEREMKDHERKIDDQGYTPSEEEKREYNTMDHSVKTLNLRRDKLIGLPQ